MDSPQIFEPAEECHSSESGWTMYIGSPEEEDENGSDLNRHVTDEEFDEDGGKYNCANRDDTSDDSMASDASSGPRHREQSWKGGSGGRTAQYCKSSEAKQNGFKFNHYKSKGSSVKKNNRSLKGKEEKDEHEVNAKGAEDLVHGSKVRKSQWMGKK